MAGNKWSDHKGVMKEFNEEMVNRGGTGLWEPVRVVLRLGTSERSREGWHS